MASAPGPAVDNGLTKHGFPQGYRFVPEPGEVFRILADKVRGRTLPRAVADTFHEFPILDYHPVDLYEAYKEFEEAGYVYFFSRREFPPLAASGDMGKERRPVRMANGGGWRPSGGGKKLMRSRKKGGTCAGKMVTMVFYERVPHEDEPVKTDWGMHEYTVPVSPSKFSDLAVYRLYKLKNGKGGKKKAWRRKARVNSSDHRAATVSVGGRSLAAPPLGQSSAGTFLTTNQALPVAASASQMQQQPGIGQAQHYYHHQYPFGAAAALGPWTWVPPPAAVNPLAQQAHATPVHGDGFPGCYSQFSGPPAPAAEDPAAEQAPAAATRSPPATPAAASPAADQHAAATASPPQDVQVAGCDEEVTEVAVPPSLEVVLPPPELASAAQDVCMDAVWSEIPDLSIDTSLVSPNDYFAFPNTYFTMDEFVGAMYPEPQTPTPMEADDPSGGDEDCQAGGKKQKKPPATLGSTA